MKQTEHPNNPLWSYACERWRKPELRELLLMLQDTAGYRVNLILLACWCAEKNISLTQHLHELDEQSSAWHLKMIQPLRQLRRCAAEEFEQSDFKERLLQLELEAERKELEDLYHCLAGREGTANSQVSTEALCITNLEAVLNHFNWQHDTETVARLCHLTLSLS